MTGSVSDVGYSQPATDGPLSSQPRVLKADAQRRLGVKVAFNFDDLRERCDGYVAQVREQTRQMILEAHREAESIRQQAHATGLEAGRTEGFQQAEREVSQRVQQEATRRTQEAIATAVPALAAAATALANERDRWLTAWEHQGVQLAAVMAQRILQTEVQVQPEHIGRVVHEVLQMASGEADIRLHLHPSDAAFINAHADDWLAAVASAGRPEVVADELVSRGGCVVRTRHGEIDARIETQVSRIVSELLAEDEPR